MRPGQDFDAVEPGLGSTTSPRAPGRRRLPDRSAPGLTSRPGRRAAARRGTRCRGAPDPASRRARNATERVAFRRALDLDEPTGVVHHHVHVGLRLGVLGVVEIQHRLSLADAHRDRRDRTVDRVAAGASPRGQAGDGVHQGDVPAGDRGGARPAVGLNHVAVDDHGALPERFHVDHRAQRPADEALDLHGATALAAPRRLARAALAGRAREHAVLGRHPPPAAALHPGRHPVLDRRVAQHPRVAELDEGGAFGVSRVAARNAHIAQFIGGTATRTHGRISTVREGGTGRGV